MPVLKGVLQRLHALQQEGGALLDAPALRADFLNICETWPAPSPQSISSQGR